MKPALMRTMVLLLLLGSCLLLPACDSFERNAYRTLKVTKVEYELLQEHAARAYLAGRLTEEQWNRFAVAGPRPPTRPRSRPRGRPCRRCSLICAHCLPPSSNPRPRRRGSAGWPRGARTTCGFFNGRGYPAARGA